jgi:hypothetical protein
MNTVVMEGLIEGEQIVMRDVVSLVNQQAVTAGILNTQYSKSHEYHSFLNSQ